MPCDRFWRLHAKVNYTYPYIIFRHTNSSNSSLYIIIFVSDVLAILSRDDLYNIIICFIILYDSRLLIAQSIDQSTSVVYFNIALLASSELYLYTYTTWCCAASATSLYTDVQYTSVVALTFNNSAPTQRSQSKSIYIYLYYCTKREYYY